MPSEAFVGPDPTDFVSEELPPDFWNDEPAPYDDAPGAQARRAPPPTNINKEAPLFDQLKQLFPGRVVRIDPLEKVETSSEDAEGGEDDAAVQDTLFD